MGLERFSLEGRLALVTGSSQGIGLALARGLGEAGAALVVNGRDTEKLAGAAETLRADGLTVHERAFDVTDGAAVIEAVDGIERDIGPIEILVNNAGMQFRTPLEEFPEEAWHRLVKTNIDSVFLVGKAVAQHMIARRGGKIINICSVQSELGRYSIAPYTMTKGAVKMLTKGMCVDWGRYNIQVNGIGPGYFNTPLNKALVEDPKFTEWVKGRTPAGRWGETDELVGAAVFLASPASSFVNGHVLYVDGGITAGL